VTAGVHALNSRHAKSNIATGNQCSIASRLVTKVQPVDDVVLTTATSEMLELDRQCELCSCDVMQFTIDLASMSVLLIAGVHGLFVASSHISCSSCHPDMLCTAVNV
jgi:hypothetical protein